MVDELTNVFICILVFLVLFVLVVSNMTTNKSFYKHAKRKNLQEQQYLDLVNKIIKHGADRPDRTGIGTYSLFGKSMTFDLEYEFPLITTKKMFWKGIVEELLWFISGSTNANKLSEKGVYIWNQNGSKEYLKSIGLEHREEGDLGPVYGFQWRHFGATYKDMHTDYTGKGVDQLAEVIKTIKTNPSSRRIVMSAWNPSDLKEMALPPCHMFCQFYVAKGKLDCVMYQRSCDMGLGVPFNIASYALLTLLVAHVCNLKPGNFTHMMGDVHVYKNHIDALKEQMTRDPKPLPKVIFDQNIKDIDAFRLDHIKLLDYECHKMIKMDMAV